MEGKGPQWPTVLIVDDDRLNRNILAEMLKGKCRILLAKDGPSALDIIAREEISLVLLDVAMPGMDGYEVLRQIKANPATADTTVIFITGLSDATDEERGLLLGAADYVQKPIRPAIVHARIQVHLKLITQRRKLEELSLQDALTGIANRRYFDEALEHTLRHSFRHQEQVGLAILDVDHFKQYNDHYGHGAGDEALKDVARIVSSFTRHPGEVAARYGGEEFVLLIPRPENFRNVLEDVRQAIWQQRIRHAASPTDPFLTLSGGGIIARASEDTTPRALLAMADTLLYQAKQTGRNKILVENSDHFVTRER